MASIQFNSYATFTELSTALLGQWLDLIDQAAVAQQALSFALAGGSTPAPLYRQLDAVLARRSIENIKLTATDERWVDDADAQSNEGLFKQCLPLSYGKQWNLISLKNTARTPELATKAIDERLQQQFPAPFSAVLLGMGNDGHIASLFPDAALQDDALSCLAALHPQSGQNRMSLSLPRLLNTKKIWLLITGAEKKQLFEKAAGANLPISALLRDARCTIEVFWCP
jgi:6-phosphogluconolactonase